MAAERSIVARLVSRHERASFVVLAYALSWMIWLPVVIALERSRGVLRSGDHGIFGAIPWWATLAALVGGYGPSVAALLIVGVTDGSPGVRSLLSRFAIWRVAVRWYAAAVVLPSVLVIAAIALSRFAGASIPAFTLGRSYLILPAFVLALPFGPLGEELGWRGFLLPQLQTGHSALFSSVVIGVAWTFWHLPLFWAPAGTTISGAPITAIAILSYLFETVCLSIMGTWLFNSTGGSVLLTVLLHAAWNQPLVTFLFSRWSEATIHSVEEWLLVPLGITAAIIVGVCGARRLDCSHE